MLRIGAGGEIQLDKRVKQSYYGGEWCDSHDRYEINSINESAAMKQNKIIQLRQGLETAFIDQYASSNLAYKPQFVSNNYREDIYEYIVNG